MVEVENGPWRLSCPTSCSSGDKKIRLPRNWGGRGNKNKFKNKKRSVYSNSLHILFSLAVIFIITGIQLPDLLYNEINPKTIQLFRQHILLNWGRKYFPKSEAPYSKNKSVNNPLRNIILTKLIFSTIAEYSVFSTPPLKVGIFSIFILKKSSETFRLQRPQGRLHLTFLILTLTVTKQKLSLKLTTWTSLDQVSYN